MFDLAGGYRHFVDNQYFLNTTWTRAKYSANVSLTPISSDSKSLFSRSYAASFASAAIFVSAPCFRGGPNIYYHPQYYSLLLDGLRHYLLC